MGHWAKMIGCRITHIVGLPVNPPQLPFTSSQGTIQTTWADFIDHINYVLNVITVGLGNFPYTDRWQDLEAILGSQSYDGSPVPGNVLDIECLWEWCTCTTLTGIPQCDMCDTNIMNYYWLSPPTVVPMITISDIYNGGALTTPVNSIANVPDDLKAAVDIISNPANGLFNTNTKELKWEKMPATGPGGVPMLPGPASTCTANRYATNGGTDCEVAQYAYGPDGGNYWKLEYGFWLGGAAGAYFGPNFINGWETWSDLLTDVKPVINASVGIPTNMLVSSSDNFDELTVKLEWY